MMHYLVTQDFTWTGTAAAFPNASGLVSIVDYLEDKLSNGWEFVGFVPGPNEGSHVALFRAVGRIS